MHIQGGQRYFSVFPQVVKNHGPPCKCTYVDNNKAAILNPRENNNCA